MALWFSLLELATQIEEKNRYQFGDIILILKIGIWLSSSLHLLGDRLTTTMPRDASTHPVGLVVAILGDKHPCHGGCNPILYVS